jgi:hypothetical protein
MALAPSSGGMGCGELPIGPPAGAAGLATGRLNARSMLRRACMGCKTHDTLTTIQHKDELPCCVQADCSVVMHKGHISM